MTPVFLVTVDGKPLGSLASGRVLSIRLTDAAGIESDAAEIEFDDKDNAIELPRRGARLEVSLGYIETGGPVLMGRYVVDDVSGGNQDGWTLTVTARAADLIETLKEQRRRSYPEGATLKSAVDQIAARNGLAVEVDAALAGLKLGRDFAVQLNESDMSYLTRLGRRHDGLIKVAGGKLVVAERGKGKAPGGKALPTVIVTAGEDISLRWRLAERPKHGAVEADFRDRGGAKRKNAVAKQGSGATQRLPTVYPDEDQAKAAARARKRDLERAEVSVTVTVPGRPEVQAEAPIRFVGYRDPVPQARFIASVEHELTKDGGFITTIEAEAEAKS